MLVIVSYDVSTMNAEGRRRLRHVAKICLNHGQRVQNSVFECLVDQTQFTYMKNMLLEEICEKEDSLRFYFLGNNWRGRVEHVGTKPSTDLEAPLII